MRFISEYKLLGVLFVCIGVYGIIYLASDSGSLSKHKGSDITHFSYQENSGGKISAQLSVPLEKSKNKKEITGNNIENPDLKVVGSISTSNQSEKQKVFLPQKNGEEITRLLSFFSDENVEFFENEPLELRVPTNSITIEQEHSYFPEQLYELHAGLIKSEAIVPKDIQSQKLDDLTFRDNEPKELSNSLVEEDMAFQALESYPLADFTEPLNHFFSGEKVDDQVWDDLEFRENEPPELR